jgi:hypothetical protein
MTEERDEAMRRQEATEAMIRMRDPARIVRSTLPIESPSQEWIERAFSFYERLGYKAIGQPSQMMLASEFSSIYEAGIEAGVKRERERLAGPLISARMALEAIAAEAILSGPCKEALDVALAQIDALTPSPTEGERS